MESGDDVRLLVSRPLGDHAISVFKLTGGSDANLPPWIIAIILSGFVAALPAGGIRDLW
ncbi:MAG: hypothetical protein M3Q03_18345 [Chloroflexota bacterium]|nr:hypothetical protein [Chloroflexota bacterium]